MKNKMRGRPSGSVNLAAAARMAFEAAASLAACRCQRAGGLQLYAPRQPGGASRRRAQRVRSAKRYQNLV